MRSRFRPLLALLLLAQASPVLPCTSFGLFGGGRLLFGKNYDWHVGSGQLIVNRRGLRKEAAPRAPGEGTPARWESRHGSVTFNQYGLESPSGGMNDAGLVIELMWLEEGVYPTPDARPVVGVLEWIQYQLDTAGSVAEVIASDTAVRIHGQAPLHYLVADRSGAMAAVEFLKGKMVAHTGHGLPLRALANSPYAASVEHFRAAGSGRPPRGDGSLRRFCEAASRSEAFAAAPPPDPVAYAFETLGRVAQPSTRWSIVYDIGAATVHFRTDREASIRRLSLSGLDLDCGRAPMAVDLNDPGGPGDLAGRLRPLTFEENLRFVRQAYAGTPFLSRASEAEILSAARRPEPGVCAGSGSPAGR